MIVLHSLLLTLIAVSFLSHSGTVYGQKEAPLACSFRGKEYRLHASWSSREPRECAQYTCAFFDQIAAVGCPTVDATNQPNKTCFDIKISYAPYPLCCTSYYCVDNDPGIVKRFAQ